MSPAVVVPAVLRDDPKASACSASIANIACYDPMYCSFGAYAHSSLATSTPEHLSLFRRSRILHQVPETVRAVDSDAVSSPHAASMENVLGLGAAVGAPSEASVDPASAPADTVAAPAAMDSMEAIDGEESLAQLIRDVIEEKVAPAIRDDGGDIELVSWEPETGVCTVRLLGACSSCDRSTVTMRMLVERALKFYVPEVTAVKRTENDSPHSREFNG